MDPPRTKFWTCAGAIFCALLFIICAIIVHARTGILAFNSDDSYIYTGYVKMAFTPGAGPFSYNVGEHSAGTTGILFYYVLLAGYRLLTIALPKSPATLVLNTWIISGICFTLTGAVMSGAVAGVCNRLKITSRVMIGSVILLALMLMCASENFLWGQMGGMENPLSALIVTSLAALACQSSGIGLRRAQSSRGLPMSCAMKHGRAAHATKILLPSMLAAGLAGTRPDFFPIAVLVPAVTLFQKSLPMANRLRATIAGYCLFAAILALVFLPLRLTTGQWQPSALGARVELHWLNSPSALLNSLNQNFNNNWGRALAGSWLAAIIFYRKTRQQPGIFLIPLGITLFLGVRAVAGLDNFNVHDRYVSYLWPAMTLTYVLAAVALLQNALGTAGSAKVAAIAPASSMIIAVGVVMLAIIPAIHEIAQDTEEMLQVHVRPSQWMAVHLPPGAVVAMEPAGALRTYTDFTLVDRTGLTTPHYQRYIAATGRKPEDAMGDFLRASRVQYLFDYPRQALFEANPGTFEVLKTW
ncbi:MAG TPA: hypothetical protein VFE47_31835, partial [Tepidisphaeraceae bacterium]|nr:hypothetical protein [Tepidisphaeraceae bacterium]